MNSDQIRLQVAPKSLGVDGLIPPMIRTWIPDCWSGQWASVIDHRQLSSSASSSLSSSSLSSILNTASERSHYTLPANCHCWYTCTMPIDVACPGLIKVPSSSGKGIWYWGRMPTTMPAVSPACVTYSYCCTFIVIVRPTTRLLLYHASIKILRNPKTSAVNQRFYGLRARITNG